MSKSSKILLGAVLLSGGLFLFSRHGAESPLPSATSVKAAFSAPTPIQAAPLQSGLQIMAPVLPAAPVGKATSPNDPYADLAEVDKAAADIAQRLESGDLAGMAKNYAPPGTEKDMLEALQKLNERGDTVRLRQLARAFAALAGQTPAMLPKTNQAKYVDHTIYGPYPPVPVAQLHPGFDLESITRIPIYFVKKDGRWYLDSQSMGLLYGAVHNTPYDKVRDANP